MEPKQGPVPTYGLLTINHAYNEGKLTFKQWLELSREWALQIAKQYEKDATDCPSPTCYTTERIDESA